MLLLSLITIRITAMGAFEAVVALWLLVIGCLIERRRKNDSRTDASASHHWGCHSLPKKQSKHRIFLASFKQVSLALVNFGLLNFHVY